jgi:hypothetical protein
LLFISGNNKGAAVALEFLPRITATKRNITALENRMKTFLFSLASLLVIVYTADAQISASGTIVVFQLAKNEFVIAADSRAAVNGGESAEDNSCKISAFKLNRTVFSSGGFSYYERGKNDLMPSWDVMNEAKRAVVESGPTGKMDATDAVDRIAQLWERNMLKRWEQMRVYQPNVVLKAASVGKGILSTGLFATSRKGSLAFAWTSIVLVADKLSIVHPDLPCTSVPCGVGKMDVFNRYGSSGKDFMTPPSPSMKSWSYELRRVIKLVDLTIAEDTSGIVGGPVDALELLKDGTIRWREKKTNCPKSSD